MTDQHERTLTITQASNATGASRKAIERKVERGVLRSVKDAAGLRRIPTSELAKHYTLLPPDQSPRSPTSTPNGHATTPLVTPGPSAPGASGSDLLDRLEKQAQELGRYRLLAERSQSTEAELAEVARARTDAEAQLRAERARVDQLAAETEQLRRQLEEAKSRQGLRGLIPRR